MKSSIALAYTPDDYEAQSYAVAGRKAAGEGFLRAYIEHGSFERACCYTPDSSAFDAFCRQVSGWSKKTAHCHHIHPQFDADLSACEVLYRADPLIDRFAWRRFDAKAYSLCGVTFTMSSREVYEALSNYAVAPLYPWDALICISESGKRLARNILEESRDYLTWRFGAVMPEPVMLPVIPLGIQSNSFLNGPERHSARNALRQKMGLSQDETAVLYSGRLNIFTKANPVPMFLGVAQCARLTGKKMALILAGWFENEADEQAIQQASKEFCPNVRVILVKRPNDSDMRRVYAAADIFVSLSDNIQETFGLTLAEAMASGLPIIASDWDGYREIVRNETDGFTIPTCLPESGSGRDLAKAYLDNTFKHPSYSGHTATMTSVSVPIFVERLKTLVEDPALRTKFGESATRRAREHFDWKTIIKRYEDLWSEQSHIRKDFSRSAYTARESFRCPDPYKAFSHYATRVLGEADALGLGASADLLPRLRTLAASSFGPETRASNEIVDAWVKSLKKSGSITVSDLLQAYPSTPRHVVMRTITHLLKIDVLKLIDDNSNSQP